MDDIDLDAPRTVLELGVPTERILMVVALVLLITAPMIPVFASQYPSQPLWAFTGNLVGIGVVLVVLRSQFQAHYVLDNEARSILSRRSLFGRETLETVGGFDDVAAVAVEARRHNTKHRSWFEYRPVLVMVDGRTVPVADDGRDLSAENELAGRLAEHLGVPCVPGAEGRVLQVTSGEEGAPPKVTQEELEGHLVPHGQAGVVPQALGLVLVLAALCYGLAWLY